MNIVILRSNDMVSDARTSREAEALAEAGHHVTVLALAGPGLPREEERNGYLVRRLLEPTTASNGDAIGKLAQARARTAAALRAAKALGVDVVHSHDTDTLAAGARIKRETGARLVWGADELFADMLLANRPSVSFAVLAYWRAIERLLVPRADAVVTVGEALAAELRRRFGVESVIVRSVPKLTPVGDRTRLRRHLGLAQGGILFLYQGLVNIGRGLTQVIDVLDRVPEVHLVIQGSGPTLQSTLAHAASSPARERVHYIGHAPFAELDEWAAGADLGDVLIENLSLNNYLSAPNKLFQYMMAGIPTLASDFPEMASVLAQGPAGLTADPGDADAVVAALVRLSRDSSLRASMGQNARRLAENKYNWDLEKQKLLELYGRLAARSTS